MNRIKNRNGEGYVDIVIIVLAVMLCIALVVKISPVFIAKSQLDTFANELIREAEIKGRIGSETTSKANDLRSQLGITPSISWSRTGNIQLDDEITVTCTMQVNIGLWDNFGSFPINLTAVASGRSEVYWK